MIFFVEVSQQQQYRQRPVSIYPLYRHNGKINIYENSSYEIDSLYSVEQQISKGVRKKREGKGYFCYKSLTVLCRLVDDEESLITHLFSLSKR